MLSFSRRHSSLLATTACLFLASCGADDVASPGAGSIGVVINQPAPTPTPTGTPTPTALTAAQFATAEISRASSASAESLPRGRRAVS